MRHVRLNCSLRASEEQQFYLILNCYNHSFQINISQEKGKVSKNHSSLKSLLISLDTTKYVSTSTSYVQGSGKLLFLLVNECDSIYGCCKESKCPIIRKDSYLEEVDVNEDMFSSRATPLLKY